MGLTMNKRLIFTLAVLLTALNSNRLQAAGDEQLHVVEDLGRLNGIALQCKNYQQAQRIKSALIEHLPKERQLGQLFEDVTNESFLAALEDKGGCPGEGALGDRVNSGIEALKMAFPE